MPRSLREPAEELVEDEKGGGVAGREVLGSCAFVVAANMGPETEGRVPDAPVSRHREAPFWRHAKPRRCGACLGGPWNRNSRFQNRPEPKLAKCWFCFVV